MSLKRPGIQISPDFAFTVRTPPIGDADLAFMQAAMAEAAPGWSVEMHGFCAEEATIVVVPEDGDDAMGPSFMISREAYGFRLDQVHWDVVTEVGVLSSLNDIVDVLRLRVAFCAELETPCSVTVH